MRKQENALLPRKNSWDIRLTAQQALAPREPDHERQLCGWQDTESNGGLANCSRQIQLGDQKELTNFSMSDAPSRSGRRVNLGTRIDPRKRTMIRRALPDD